MVVVMVVMVVVVVVVVVVVKDIKQHLKSASPNSDFWRLQRQRAMGNRLQCQYLAHNCQRKRKVTSPPEQYPKPLQKTQRLYPHALVLSTIIWRQWSSGVEQGDLVEDVIATAAVGPSPKLEERCSAASLALLRLFAAKTKRKTPLDSRMCCSFLAMRSDWNAIISADRRL